MPRRGRNEEIPEKLSLKINGLIFLRTDNRGAVIFFRSCDDLFFNLHAPHGVEGVKSYCQSPAEVLRFSYDFTYYPVY